MCSRATSLAIAFCLIAGAAHAGDAIKSVGGGGSSFNDLLARVLALETGGSSAAEATQFDSTPTACSSTTAAFASGIDSDGDSICLGVDGIDAAAATTRTGGVRLKFSSHNTNCTSLTDGEAREPCYEEDANALYVCEPTAGGCDTAGEWQLISGGGGGGDVLMTDIDSSDELFGIVGDGTGVIGGFIVGNNEPSITNIHLLGQVDINDSPVSDDDCSGDIGRFWYDDTDGQFEWCPANTGTPSTLGSPGGSGTVIGVTADSGGTTTGATISLLGGTNGIDTVRSTDTVTFNLDTTEITSATFGAAGGGFTWTFNTGTTDPAIDFGDGFLRLDTVPVRVGDAGTVNTSVGDGDLYIEDHLEVDGASSFVGAATFTGGIGATTATTPSVADSDTSVATTAFVNAEIVNDVPTKTYGTASPAGTCTQGTQYIETDVPRLCDCILTDTFRCVALSAP